MSYLLSKYNLISYKSSYDNSGTTTIMSSTSTKSIPGTRITFTPIVKTNFIIYECYLTFGYEGTDNTNEISLELFEDQGSGFSAFDDTYCFKEGALNVRFSDICHVKYRIPCYSGTRTYELRGRAQTTSELAEFPDSFSSTLIYPSVAMYSYVE